MYITITRLLTTMLFLVDVKNRDYQMKNDEDCSNKY